MPQWMFDAFFWLVVPVAVFEAWRVARSELKQERRPLVSALAFGGLELAILAISAATASPLLFASLIALRIGIVAIREGQLFDRRALKFGLIGVACVLLDVAGEVDSFAQTAQAELEPWLRRLILGLVGAACILAILPVDVADEAKETLVAPVALIAFARTALPLGTHEPQFAVLVPILAASLSLVCVLWLLSAGTRANQFEHSTLVSELLVCERGVMLSFVWLGLSSGSDLAAVGGLVYWWSGALALLALEASLRRRPLPKPMAFFALAMAVSIPGTIGFIGEDLLANGLLELRPILAAVFMGVTALNAAALYLALVNIVVDLRDEYPTHLPQPTEGGPSIMMLTAATLALAIGLVPASFVDLATRAREAVVQQPSLHD